MKIRRKKEIYLEGDKVKMVLVKNPAKFTSEKTEADIIILLNKEANLTEDNNKFLLTSPGEYEVKDVLIFAQSIAKQDQLDLLALDIDGVNVVYVGSEVTNLSSETIDQVGVCHVMLIELNNDKLNSHIDLVNEFEPFVVIPLTDDKESLTKFAASLGVSIPEAQNYINYSASDFEEEDEAATSLAILS